MSRNVEVVPIPLSLNRRWRSHPIGTVFAFWLKIDGVELIIDSGAPHEASNFIDALRALGARPDFGVLTHDHIDHVGGMGPLKQWHPSIRILAHPNDHRALATGDLSIPRKLGVITPLRFLGPTVIRRSGYQPFEPDGELAELTNLGLECLPTPGHATNHTSFRLPNGWIIAGDAVSGNRRLVNEFYDDRPQLLASLRKIAQLAEGWVYPSHQPRLSVEMMRERVARIRS